MYWGAQPLLLCTVNQAVADVCWQLDLLATLVVFVVMSTKMYGHFHQHRVFCFFYAVDPS